MKNIRGDILAFMAVIGLLSCVHFLVIYDDLSETTINAVMFIAGVLASAVRDVYSFEFGSSRSSKEKSEFLMREVKDNERIQ